MAVTRIELTTKVVSDLFEQTDLAARIKTLKQNYPRFSDQVEDLQCSLREAVKAKRIDIINILLEKNIDLNFKVSVLDRTSWYTNDQSLLYFAVTSSCLPIVQSLINAGVKITSDDVSAADQLGNKEMIELLKQSANELSADQASKKKCTSSEAQLIDRFSFRAPQPQPPAETNHHPKEPTLAASFRNTTKGA
jgi:hypothetical protein